MDFAVSACISARNPLISANVSDANKDLILRGLRDLLDLKLLFIGVTEDLVAFCLSLLCKH